MKKRITDPLLNVLLNLNDRSIWSVIPWFHEASVFMPVLQNTSTQRVTVIRGGWTVWPRPTPPFRITPSCVCPWPFRPAGSWWNLMSTRRPFSAISISCSDLSTLMLYSCLHQTELIRLHQIQHPEIIQWHSTLQVWTSACHPERTPLFSWLHWRQLITQHFINRKSESS